MRVEARLVLLRHRLESPKCFVKPMSLGEGDRTCVKVGLGFDQGQWRRGEVGEWRQLGEWRWLREEVAREWRWPYANRSAARLILEHGEEEHLACGEQMDKEHMTA